MTSSVGCSAAFTRGAVTPLADPPGLRNRLWSAGRGKRDARGRWRCRGREQARGDHAPLYGECRSWKGASRGCKDDHGEPRRAVRRDRVNRSVVQQIRVVDIEPHTSVGALAEHLDVVSDAAGERDGRCRRIGQGDHEIDGTARADLRWRLTHRCPQLAQRRGGASARQFRHCLPRLDRPY